MKRIVVYQSGTGFTAQYAKWIAESLQCEAKELKKVKANELSQYSRVIYGGYLMANMVSGLDKLKKMNPKDLIVFSVGMSSPNSELEEKIIEQNQLKGIPFFYFQGGVKMKELGFLQRQMLKMIKKSLEKKEEKTAEDIKMLKMFNGEMDGLDVRAIESLVRYCK